MALDIGNGEPGMDCPLGSYRTSQNQDYLDPTLSWKDIDWLLSFARTPVLLKGILDVDDADLGIKTGVAGIMVSNHGGRNLDPVPLQRTHCHKS